MGFGVGKGWNRTVDKYGQRQTTSVTLRLWLRLIVQTSKGFCPYIGRIAYTVLALNVRIQCR